MAVALKESYDVGERVADDPLVQVIDGFVTDAERTHVIDQARGRTRRARVSGTTSSIESDGRTGSVHWMPHDRTPVVHRLVGRISRLVGIPTAHAESLQVVHYDESEEYRPHFDAYDLDTDKGRVNTRRGGQRVVTALCYLCGPDRGGATVFPELGLRIDARPGRMVLFHNVADSTLVDTTRHPRSLHGGTSVQSGEKWACNLWFRQHAHRPTARLAR